ncbi:MULTISPECIES: hypothetical protein [unclassified Janthinobacterium]|uniref:hypothetical protein n=1 Tax=unclassified Janthinobacterium TaxID=2610881 RepID=UPI00034B080F|nr:MULTISPECIES: hypothetical protein [unclassified Janthinobacterium]MEC5160584.1 hypothetical protein [Janthinobacterium sp. CG_S6]
MSDFYKYFKENMDGLGLPAPETLFGNAQLALGNLIIFLSQIDKFGKTVTIGELIGAGTKLEQLGVIAALSASFYAGAVIGSIAIATGRSLAGGTSISDVLLVATKYGVSRPWLPFTLRRWPGIYNNAIAGRTLYRYQAATA